MPKPIPDEPPPIERVLTFMGTLSAFGLLLGELPKLLSWSKTTPSTLLEHQADRQPNGLALAWEDQRFSWRDVDARSNQYATFFANRGIRTGDVVALVMDNRPDFLFVLHGLNKLGAVTSLINHHLVGASLSHALRICAARKVVAGSEHIEPVDAAVDAMEELTRDSVWVVADPGIGPSSDRRCIDAEVAVKSGARANRGCRPRLDDTFCYIYTSGTTGLPKAAIISVKRVLVASIAMARMMFRSAPGDVVYVTLPLYHSSAMFLGWNHVLATGAALALRRKFSASNFFPDCQRFGATSFLYIGELCRYLLNSPVQEGERNHSLKVGVGNGMRPDIWLSFQRRFGVPLIREFYGATEGVSMTFNTAGRPGMIGRRLPGQLVARCNLETGDLLRNSQGRGVPVNTGETGLLLSRISKLTGYDGYVDRKASEKKVVENVLTEGDRYFNTGDLVQLHDRGWLSFADRVGDTYRWKGENVSTNEVAETLNRAEGVREANVYGVRVPNADGRAGMTALSVESDFDLERFAAFAEGALPSYQRPIFVRILGADMKITGTFKHQKVDYRKQGYDPAVVDDALYVMHGGRYTRLDRSLYEQIETGEIELG